MKNNPLPPLAAPGCPNEANCQLRPRRQTLLGASLLAVVSSIAICQADIIEFDLSPLGTSPGLGLSPKNETGPIVTSSGSGNKISGGITFDTATSTLFFTMGYGSAAGFTNLTGAATAMHIHGPAPVGVAGPVLFDLATVHFPSVVPVNGGVIYGSVVYSPAQAAGLLAGLNYVNIHTGANPGGEIRGQLIRRNAAPGILGPEDSTEECGELVVYSAIVTDFDGDAVKAVWTLNGVPVQTEDIPAGGPPTTKVITYTAALPDGENTLGVVATDSHGNVTSSSATITVEDTVPPVIVSVCANPSVLWAPNHKLVPVCVTAKVIDACGPASWKILSVSSNQTATAKGSGNTSPDWVITGDHTVLLRAERSGNDKCDRIYTITVQAMDDAGNKSKISCVKVTVPHDQGGDDHDDDKDKDKGKGKDKDKGKGKDK